MVLKRIKVGGRFYRVGAKSPFPGNEKEEAVLTAMEVGPIGQVVLTFGDRKVMIYGAPVFEYYGSGNKEAKPDPMAGIDTSKCRIYYQKSARYNGIEVSHPIPPTQQISVSAIMEKWKYEDPILVYPDDDGKYPQWPDGVPADDPHRALPTV